MGSLGNSQKSALEKTGWHELLCKTNFSFLAGASHPQDCLEQVSRCSYRSVAVVDFDGVYGSARSHLVWSQGFRNQFHLIHGAEIHLAEDHDRPILQRRTLALLCTSKKGYASLCQILSYAHRQSKNKAFLTLAELLQFDLQELIAIKPARGWLHGEEDFTLCHALKESFPQRFFVALTRLLHPYEDLALHKSRAMAQALSLPTIFSQDVFFHQRSEKRLSDLLHAIRTNLTLAEATAHFFPNTERSFHSLQELGRLYGSDPDFAGTLQRMQEISLSCQFDMSELKYRYPQEFIPPGFSAMEFLRQLTWQSAEKKYGSVPDHVRTLLNHELSLIETLGFADYFLTVWDIVRWAKEQQILCQGRGSAANSAVCFVLSITNVDPKDFDVLFERFISVERGDPPDIDVDFEHERREEVIQYIYQRYGREKAAMLANVICFKKKGALRAVGKALGIPEIFLKEVSEYMSVRQYRREKIQKTLETLTDVDSLNTKTLHLWEEMTEKLRGFPRHLGLHSGGFLLSHEPIDDIVPREPATMPGRTVIQWCKEDVEGLGFFKVDFLALGMLTAIRKMLSLLKKDYGIELTVDSIPSDDRETYAMIQAAKTIGTFQIESRAQMSMLPRLKPEKFYDLVIEVAIIRPGPIQGKMIHPYLRRRRGLEPETYPDERLVPILKRTLGIPIFQEQVMRIAMAVGDFTAGEANELRKNMGSFSLKGDVGKWVPKLISGMRRNKLSEEFIACLVGQLQGFSAYGFPESHAVSFAHIAYISSYLKAHFPPAFYAGIINSQPMGFYSVHTLLQAAKSDGVVIKPVCVMHSEWDITLEKDAASCQGFALRLGMRLVTGLSQSGAEKFLQKRTTYSHIEHFLRECGLSRVDLTALAAVDGFKVFGLERREALWLAEAAPYQEPVVEERVSWKPLTQAENIQLDFQTQKTTLGDHPVQVIKREGWAYDIAVSRLTSAQNLQCTPVNARVAVFGMVIIRQAPPTAKGMVFLTLEDEEGLINLVLTPQMYDRFQKKIDFKGFVCAEGKLQNDSGSISILVQNVLSPEERLAQVLPFHLREEEVEVGVRNYM